MTKKELKVWEVIKNMGYVPQENKNIIVSYAAANLSAKVASFFTNEFYVLQICEKELVLIPFSKLSGELKKEIALEISFDSIKSIKVDDDNLNYIIYIETNEDKISLSTQQKELSHLRSSGVLSATNIWTGGNWHRDNLDGTLERLKELGK